ncbi:MAG: ABC transporter permease subunit [Clostridiales bacterium]|jgi:putative aldouronate transport system permease protein|nr:ABC transporter permease subunit [Clostridiales bacterium]
MAQITSAASAPPAPATARKRRFGSDNVELAILGLPVIVWFILFAYIPMFGILIAFKRYRPLGENFIDSLIQSEWMGLDNFTFLFKTPDAAIFFRNTLLYNALFIVTGIGVSVTLAIMISLIHSRRLAKTCQTLMFLPHFLSWVVVGYFVFAFLSSDKGFVNQTIKSFGGQPVQWYVDSKYWPAFLVLINTWKTMGYSMIVYLASITGIDQSLYEAAAIDGSSKWQQVRYITLPMLVPIITIMFILAVGRIFTSDFGLFYNVPRRSGPLSDVTQTIDVYVYNALMQRNNIGFAASASVTQSIIGFVTILTANFVVSKLNPENSLF